MGTLQVSETGAPMRSRVCAECGSPFVAHATLARRAEFCGPGCRSAFNNRRSTRGVVIYDLFMALRYERKLAKKLGVWRQLCRLARDFRAEDHAQRESRKSWRAPATVLAERPYLNAIVLSNKTWPVRLG